MFITILHIRRWAELSFLTGLDDSKRGRTEIELLIYFNHFKGFFNSSIQNFNSNYTCFLYYYIFVKIYFHWSKMQTGNFYFRFESVGEKVCPTFVITINTVELIGSVDFSISII